MLIVVVFILPYEALDAVDADTSQRQKSPFDLAVGFSGTNAINSAAAAETFYWGPYARIAYEVAEPLKLRLGIRNYQDRFLYDGLGNVARQSSVGISPGISWDITDNINLDFEYTYRFGPNNLLEHAQALSLDIFPTDFFRIGFVGNYGVQKYVFPNLSENVTQHYYGFMLDSAIIISKQLEFPLIANISASSYSTNNTPYSARTFSPGITVATKEKMWSFTADAIFGLDSSDYAITGVEARLRFKPWQQISIRLSASYSDYTFQGGDEGRARRNQGISISPYGNNDEYYLQSLGFDVAYTLL